jgi:hypothetical protein
MANSHSIPNRVSLDITQDELKEITTLLDAVDEKLDPNLVSLLPDERRDVSKMGPRTSDFVKRTMSYMRSLPQFLPAFVDIDEFQKDLDGVEMLTSLQHRLARSSRMVDDTMMTAGCEALAASLACYDSLKSAAKHGSPEAVAAVADLSERMPRRRASKPVPVEVPPGAPGADPTRLG